MYFYHRKLLIISVLSAIFFFDDLISSKRHRRPFSSRLSKTLLQPTFIHPTLKEERKKTILKTSVLIKVKKTLAANELFHDNAFNPEWPFYDWQKDPIGKRQKRVGCES